LRVRAPESRADGNWHIKWAPQHVLCHCVDQVVVKLPIGFARRQYKGRLVTVPEAQHGLVDNLTHILGTNHKRFFDGTGEVLLRGGGRAV